jgi:hypothetical protein
VAVALAVAALVLVLGRDALAAVGAGVGAALIAHLVRTIVEDGPAGLVGAATAGLAWGVLVAPAPRLAVVGLGVAAAAWALADLARGPGIRPLALIAAVAAALAAPAFVGLLLVVGGRLLAQRPMPRWAPAVPMLAVVGLAIGIPAALAHGGALAGLWRTWSGMAPLSRPGLGWQAAAAFTAEALGPIAAVAALIGLGLVIARRWVAVALAALAVIAALTEVRLATVGVALPLLAAIAIGAAIARLGALVRLPIGQALVGATAGFVVVAPSAWLIFTA